MTRATTSAPPNETTIHAAMPTASNHIKDSLTE